MTEKWSNHWKTWKMRNSHCRTWNMVRKLKITENEKHPLEMWKMTKSLKNMKNEKWTLQDLEYGKKTENQGKREIHTLGCEIRRGKLKNVENLEMSIVGRGIRQENWKSWKMRKIHLTTSKMTKSLKNVKNEKCTLKDLEYGEKTENHGKWEIHTLGHEIWRGKLKKVES